MEKLLSFLFETNAGWVTLISIVCLMILCLMYGTNPRDRALKLTFGVMAAVLMVLAVCVSVR